MYIDVYDQDILDFKVYPTVHNVFHVAAMYTAIAFLIKSSFCDAIPQIQTIKHVCLQICILQIARKYIKCKI